MLNLKQSIHEKFLFFSKFLKSPGQVGSITPSSPFLAKAMVNAISWDTVCCAAEFGAGTGAITKFIHASAQKRAKVLVFETDVQMRQRLAEQYPGFECHPDCRDLQRILERERLGELDCIISGLPFFNFPQQLRDDIMAQAVASLKEDGLFVAFQYSQQMKRQLNEQFVIEDIKFVPMNVPPAFVYVCRKKGGAPA